MRIYTFWHDAEDELSLPWLEDAIDEVSIDNGADMPDHSKNPKIRMLVIQIPEKAVTDLFKAPEVKGTPVEED